MIFGGDFYRRYYFQAYDSDRRSDNVEGKLGKYSGLNRQAKTRPNDD